MIGGKGKKCLGISELPIVDSFSCGEEIGDEGMLGAEQMSGSRGHCSVGGSSPPATGWLHQVISVAFSAY